MTATLSEPALALWPHQARARDAVHAAIAAGRTSGLVVLPTGAGKTVLFLTLTRDLGRPALVLVHRDELIKQTVRSAARAWPEAAVGVVQAERDEWAGGQQLVVASVQSLHARRLERMPPGRFGLVVIDEAHHTPAASYCAVIDRFSDRHFLLGVTATPDRLDGVGLARWYGDEPLFSYPIRQAVEDGVLARPRQLQVLTNVSLDGVAAAAGGRDLSEPQLARAVNTPGRNAAIAEAYRLHASARRGIAFCVDVQHATDLSATLNDAGVRSAAVTGKLPAEERAALLDGFAEADLQVVTSCLVLTEGFDDPAVDCVVMARPTASRSLYVQCVGRGLRAHPGKGDCLVLDVTDNCRRHKLVNITDLADVAEGPAGPPREAGEGDGGGAQLPAEPGYRKGAAPVEWALVEACPWPSLPSLDNYRPLYGWHSLPATDKQLQMLRKMHLAPARALTRGEASFLIDLGVRLHREHPQPATDRQRYFLERRGLWREGTARREASRMIAAVWEN